MKRVESLRVIRVIRIGFASIERAIARLSDTKISDRRQEKFDCESRRARFDLARRERVRFDWREARRAKIAKAQGDGDPADARIPIL